MLSGWLHFHMEVVKVFSCQRKLRWKAGKLMSLSVDSGGRTPVLKYSPFDCLIFHNTALNKSKKAYQQKMWYSYACTIVSITHKIDNLCSQLNLSTTIYYLSQTVEYENWNWVSPCKGNMCYGQILTIRQILLFTQLTRSYIYIFNKFV